MQSTLPVHCCIRLPAWLRAICMYPLQSGLPTGSFPRTFSLAAAGSELCRICQAACSRLHSTRSDHALGLLCRRHVDFSCLPRPPSAPVRDESELAQLESLHRIYSLYIWLAQRLQPAFSGQDTVSQYQLTCSRLIDEGLYHIGKRARLQELAAKRIRQSQETLGVAIGSQNA